MKRRLHTTYRIIRTGFVNFVRNLSLAAAAIAVMTVTLTIILFSVIASTTFNHTITQLTDKIDISVYLSSSASDSQVQTLEKQLNKLVTVKSVDYISQDQALADYEAENPGDTQFQTVLKEIGNPLPASLEIHPVDPNQIQPIKNFLDKPQNVLLEDAQNPTSYSGNRKQAIDNIAKATRILKEAGVLTVIVFALISVLIIFNTLRMAIFNRRDEIGIMRLLGASTWYIRGPFVVENVLYGIISALLSTSLVYILFNGSASALHASSLGLLDIGYASSYLKAHTFLLLTIQLMIGIVIGTVSSIIATRRYLKFKTIK